MPYDSIMDVDIVSESPYTLKAEDEYWCVFDLCILETDWARKLI